MSHKGRGGKGCREGQKGHEYDSGAIDGSANGYIFDRNHYLKLSVHGVVCKPQKK